jgi:hypothetical protein
MSSKLRLLQPVTVTTAMLTACNVAEPATGDTPDPAAYNAATTYALAARCHVASTHMIYESVQAANVGHDPATDTTLTWWTPVVATNRWRMFDARNTSKTSKAGGIDLTLAPGAVYSGLHLGGMSGVSSAQVTMTDATVGVVYDKTTDMQVPMSSSDWYTYFFEPVEVGGESVIATDLPIYPNATIRVQLFTASPLAVASIGVCVVGNVKEIGMGLNYGVRVGIQDYSRKERNAYGDMLVVERAFAKRASFEMHVPRAEVDAVQTLLASVRATPCVWIGSDMYSSTVIFGFYKDFDISIQYFDFSVLTLSLEGLT